MKEQWMSDKWNVSYLNFLDEVRASFKIPKKVSIHDITLRDGEQQAARAKRKTSISNKIFKKLLKQV